jgi:hypothetical protein
MEDTYEQKQRLLAFLISEQMLLGDRISNLYKEIVEEDNVIQSKVD